MCGVTNPDRWVFRARSMSYASDEKFIDRILIFLGSAVLVVSVVFILASRTCDKPRLIWFRARAPRNLWRLLFVARRNSVLRLPVGAYENEMTGVMECRNRVTGPKPGKSANNVGEAERLMVGRFDW